jgi:hypothetical protein
MDRACNKNGVRCELMVGKPEGKIPLGLPRSRCVDDIEIYLGRDRMGWY